MSPSRICLFFLAVIGSFDIGFSFANANKFPTSSSSPSFLTTTTASSSSFYPRGSNNNMATLSTTTTIRQRRIPSQNKNEATTTTISKATNAAMEVTGGDDNNKEGKEAVVASNYNKSISIFLASLWGSGGVIYILAKAIKRVIPIAMEPFSEGAVPLSQVQLGIYAVTCLWFAYVEGYKGFQTKFSPLVVKRSLTLQPGKSGIHHLVLAPLYSMGLFHATKKRKIVSWSVTIGVAAVVAAVKRFPYPWRNIVDAGVVAGLTWGSLSILIIYMKAWIMGKPPAIDPALP